MEDIKIRWEEFKNTDEQQARSVRRDDSKVKTKNKLQDAKVKYRNYRQLTKNVDLVQCVQVKLQKS